MEPSPVAHGSVSENFHKVPSARFLESTKSCSQLSIFPSQSTHQGGNGGDAHTHDSAKFGLAPDSPGAAEAGAKAKGKEDGPALTNDLKDDVSVSSIDLECQREDQHNNFKYKHGPWLEEGYKEKGTKYARAAAIYTEGLEIRVGSLEKELLELQYNFSSKERPERQVTRPTL